LPNQKVEEKVDLPSNHRPVLSFLLLRNTALDFFLVGDKYLKIESSCFYLSVKQTVKIAVTDENTSLAITLTNVNNFMGLLIFRRWVKVIIFNSASLFRF